MAPSGKEEEKLAACRALYQACFHDEEAFMDLYFSRRYRDDLTFTDVQDGRIVSAMQSLPYDCSYGSSLLQAGYVSGLCTDPSYRGRGCAGRVLTLSHQALYDRGAAFSFLIPANAPLFDFYQGHHYAPCFTRYKQRVSSPSPSALPFRVSLSRHLLPEVVAFIRDHLSARPFAILHSPEDIADIWETARMSNGGFFVAHRRRHLEAVAVVEFSGKDLRILDSFGSADAIQTIVRHLWERYAPTGFRLRRYVYSSHAPARRVGMVRIIRLEQVLSAYARLHPQVTLQLHVHSDPSFPQNNGYFRLTNGVATAVAETPLAESLTIDEAAVRFLSDAWPVMSMMLD